MRAMKTLLPSMLLLALAVPGCTRSGYLEMPSLQALARPTIVDEPFVFDIAGAIEVDVESFGGNVTVVAAPSLDKAWVEVTRDARHGFMREDEARASLTQIDYTADLVNTEAGHVLTVRTWTSHDQPYQQRAHVLIMAPEVTNLKLRTRNGDVHTEMTQGSVDIETSNGNVLVMTERPMTDSVTIVNKDGDIDYRVQGDSTARIDARTVRGRVLQRVRDGSLIVEAATGHDTMLATLNNGTNPVTLRTVDGNIRIAVVEEPLKVGAVIRDP